MTPEPITPLVALALGIAGIVAGVCLIALVALLVDLWRRRGHR
jgi:hypothetical protein